VPDRAGQFFPLKRPRGAPSTSLRCCHNAPTQPAIGARPRRGVCAGSATEESKKKRRLPLAAVSAPTWPAWLGRREIMRRTTHSKRRRPRDMRPHPVRRVSCLPNQTTELYGATGRSAAAAAAAAPPWRWVGAAGSNAGQIAFEKISFAARRLHLESSHLQALSGPSLDRRPLPTSHQPTNAGTNGQSVRCWPVEGSPRCYASSQTNGAYHAEPT
jgi:hypothetical protein